jgi:hypothetical protein
LKLVEGEAVPGSTLYIPNGPHYSQFKPHGPGRGSNLFCVGRDQYVGFSRIYQNGPQPLQVIEEQDFMLFADPADVECDYENHSKMCQIFQKKTPADITLFEYTRRAEQIKNHNYCHVFDGKVINKCKKLIDNNNNISNQVGNIGMKR